MIEATLDYETRSKVSLDQVGAIEYAKHPSTSILCVGYKVDDGPCKLWLPERSPMPPELWEVFKQGTLVAHNAGFERAITRYTLTCYPFITPKQREIIEALPVSRWRCTAAKAAASSLPRSLEGATKALGLATQKDMEGNRLVKKYMKPRRPSKKNPKLWWDDKWELRKIYRYCLTDVQAEWELDQAIPDLTPYEQKVWELDQKINERGILIDIPTVKIILRMIHEESANITAGVKVLAQGEIDKVTQTAKVLAWVNERGACLPNLRAATLQEKLLENDLNPKVRLMLEYRQGGSKTSTAKYLKMLQCVGPDHRARELLLYHGATPTARFSGKRIQPQNFPRPTIPGFNSNEAIELIKTGGLPALQKKYGAPNVIKVLVSAIRGMLIASEGCELFDADWAAVEARLAFWVAEHEEGVIAFREGKKLYEEMAALTFGIDISKVLKDSLERFIGKESLLGCQYGMGWKKFQAQCRNKGKIISDEIAKKAVYAYREKHHPVPAMWKNLERAVINAIQNPGTRHRLHKVTIYVKGDFLNIKLPSGRRLRYYKPSIRQKQLMSGYLVPEIRCWAMDLHMWREVTYWGGIFTNHIVQGIARDLLVVKLFEMEAAKYRVLVHMHDEVLSEREKGCGRLEEYLNLMAGNLPAWASGAPIRAEGWQGPRYHK